MSKNFVDLDNAVELMNGIENRIEKNFFQGTQDEWEALTDEQKAIYHQKPVHIKNNGGEAIDLSGYQKKNLDSPVTVGGVQQTQVEGAIGALNDVKGDKSVLDNEIATRSALGAHNLLPFDLTKVKALNTTGTWTGDTYSYNDVTFTVASDGKVTVDGTASANAILFLDDSTDYGDNTISTYSGITSKANGYAISDGISNGDVGTNPFGGATFEGANNKKTYVVVLSGKTADNVTLEPMIRLATDSDTTYQPYAKANKQLTGDIDGEIETRVAAGAHNYASFDMPMSNAGNMAYTKTDTGVRITNSTSATYRYYQFALCLEKNTDYVISTKITATAGTGGIVVKADNTEGLLTAGNITGNVSYTFNSGNHSTWYFAVYSAFATAAIGNVLYENFLIRRASDPSADYQPFAMTNQQLTGDMLYSTNEVDTGKTWIDGKKIYRKVVNLGAMPNKTIKTTAHGITNADRFVDIRGIAYVSNSNTHLPIPYVNSGANMADTLGIYVNATNVAISSPNYDFSAYSGYAILEYTKSTG